MIIINKHLLPVAMKTRKPPTKRNINAVQKLFPSTSFSTRDWQAIKFRVWAQFQKSQRLKSKLLGK